MEKIYLEFYNQGFTDSEISEFIKKSIWITKSIRWKLNLKPNDRFTKLIPELKRLCSFNYSDKKISENLNFSVTTVAKYRKQLNIKPSMPELTYKNQYDRIRGYMIRNVKFSAKRRDKEFNLHFTDFELPEYCPLLNIKLQFIKEGGDGNDFNHATLDRIDNNKGYVKGNVIVISRLANAMKNEANFEQLETFSQNILKLINFYKNHGALGSITDLFPNLILKT